MLPQFFSSFTCAMSIGLYLAQADLTRIPVQAIQNTCQIIRKPPNFLAIGGGGAPAYNEIALEKNLLYFQRILVAMGYAVTDATFLFANGNDGQATVRYFDQQGIEKFKAPNIPHLKGAATLTALENWLESHRQSDRQIFLYFTGHGFLNKQNSNNNFLMLWPEQSLSVQQFSNLLKRLSPQTTVTTVMAQCYSGSFANMIYEDGDPQQLISTQKRCGFFATIKTLPSVGCTPQVNEADYNDYSSSFFAGLSGINRVGKPTPSADYNNDGKVSYTEAHAFAKVDERSTDLPISTSEAWLQGQASGQNRYQIFSQPIYKLLALAHPEQKYVITSLSKVFNLNLNHSWRRVREDIALTNNFLTEEQKAYFIRLQMELINVGMEQQVLTSNHQTSINTLKQLQQCEGSSW